MEWYENEVRALEKNTNAVKPYNPIIFYGSSTIRMWSSLQEDFKEYPILNLGFGGSTLEACVWFFDRLISPCDPKKLVLYAGDNDLGDGKSPEEVYHFFLQFLAKMTNHFPGTSFTFVSVKPSPARFGILQNIRKTNELIENEILQHPSVFFLNVFDHMLDNNGSPMKEFFEEDGLHLNRSGYVLWKDIFIHNQARIF